MEHILGQVQKQLKQGLENAWTLGQDVISNVPDGWEIMDMNRTWTMDNEHEHGFSSEDWKLEFEEWMDFDMEKQTDGYETMSKSIEEVHVDSNDVVGEQMEGTEPMENDQEPGRIDSEDIVSGDVEAAGQKQWDMIRTERNSHRMTCSEWERCGIG